MEKDELTLRFCFYSVLTNWRTSLAHTVRHFQRDESEKQKKKKRNHLWRDGSYAFTSRKIQIRSRRVHKHRVPTSTFFFGSLGKDNLGDYSGHAHRQRCALSCLVSCFMNSHFFPFTSSLSLVHFPVFRASFATQMTMDGIRNVLRLIIIIIIFWGAKTVQSAYQHSENWRARMNSTF